MAFSVLQLMMWRRLTLDTFFNICLEKTMNMLLWQSALNPGGRKRPSNFAPAHEYAMFLRIE